MITLEQVKKTAFGFGFDIEHFETTKDNYFTISGSFFTLKLNNINNQIKLNSKEVTDISREQLMEELSEMHVIREELNDSLIINVTLQT